MRPAAGTRLLAAYRACLALLRDRLEPLGFQVVDGPRAAQALQDDAVLVGVSEGAGMTMTRTRVGMGPRVDEEFDLQLIVSSQKGDTDLQPRRDRIQVVLDDLAALCEQRPAVEDLVDSLALGGDILMAQDQTEDGATVEVALTLHGRILG